MKKEVLICNVCQKEIAITDNPFMDYLLLKHYETEIHVCENCIPKVNTLFNTHFEITKNPFM